METIDYVIFGILIALTLSFGLAWIITKGKFVKYNRELTAEEEVTLHRRSILAGVFFIIISVIMSVSMVAMHFNVQWLMVTCFAITLVCCVCFIVVSRLIYRRKR
ncbi:MAG: hypothetical protein J6X00_03180 [Clostridia bacterium]|nr:hypothetical protein [Clostridia bacterium]